MVPSATVDSSEELSDELSLIPVEVSAVVDIMLLSDVVPSGPIVPVGESVASV